MLNLNIIKFVVLSTSRVEICSIMSNLTSNFQNLFRTENWDILKLEGRLTKTKLKNIFSKPIIELVFET